MSEDKDSVYNRYLQKMQKSQKSIQDNKQIVKQKQVENPPSNDKPKSSGCSSPIRRLCP